jgi:hypothetical protein
MKTKEPIRESIRFGLPQTPILHGIDRVTVLATSALERCFFATDELASAGTTRLVTKPQPRTTRTSAHVFSIASTGELCRGPGGHGTSGDGPVALRKPEEYEREQAVADPNVLPRLLVGSSGGEDQPSDRDLSVMAAALFTASPPDRQWSLC